MYGNPPDMPVHSSDTEKQRAFKGVGPQRMLDGQASLTQAARTPSRMVRGSGSRRRSRRIARSG